MPIDDTQALDAAIRAYFLGDFMPLYWHLPSLQEGTEVYHIQLGRMKLVQAYGTLEGLDLPAAPQEVVLTAQPLFLIAEMLDSMKGCTTRESVLRLSDDIDREASKLTANPKTAIDGQIVKIQMLRFLPPFAGGSREEALKLCNQLEEAHDQPTIAEHFRSLIGMEIGQADG